MSAKPGFEEKVAAHKARLESALADPSLRTVTAETIMNEQQLRAFMGAVKETVPLEWATGLSRNEELFEDSVRWSPLGHRCARLRAEPGLTIPDVARTLKLRQYRLRAIEKGWISSLDPLTARRYFEFLGVSRWVGRWAGANPELARRAGLKAPLIVRKGSR